MILLLMALNCPYVKVINYTNKWNRYDTETVFRAKKRCPALYPHKPCLTQFYKLSDKNYHAICGKTND